MKQIESDKYYMKVAKACAENSKAVILHVGAIIVKDSQIISDGFNGTPSGFDNQCEITKKKDISKCVRCTWEHCEGCDNLFLETKPEVLHAESNAITKCAKSGRASLGSTIYVTHAPCISCAKLIIQAGIIRVVYGEDYKNTLGIELLQKAGIKVEKYNG